MTDDGAGIRLRPRPLVTEPGDAEDKEEAVDVQAASPGDVASPISSSMMQPRLDARGKFEEVEVEVAFIEWFESSLVYMQIGLLLLCVHTGIFIRYNTGDSPMILLFLWLFAVSTSALLFWRHRTRHAATPSHYSELVAKHLNAYRLLTGTVFLMTMHTRLFVDLDEAYSLSLRRLERLTRHPQAMGVVFAMLGMVLGTIKVSTSDVCWLVASVSVRFAQFINIARGGYRGPDTPPSQMSEAIWMGLVAVLCPMVFGALAVRPYEHLARNLWAQSEGKTKSLRAELEALHGHVSVVESYRRQELAERQKQSTVEQLQDSRRTMRTAAAARARAVQTKAQRMSESPAARALPSVAE